MTLPQAHETARNAADRFGNSWRVYRLPAWPPAVYGCKAGDLPGEAVIVETYPKPAPRTPHLAPDASADAAQGSLF